LEKIDTLLDLIQSDAELNLINEKVYSLLNVGWLYLRTNAYSSLNESGDIRFIKNFEKRKKIVDLYEYYAWTESVNQIAYSSYSANVYPYLKRNLDFISKTPQKREVYKNKVFLNGLVTYRNALFNKNKKLKDCQEVVDTFLKDTP